MDSDAVRSTPVDRRKIGKYLKEEKDRIMLVDGKYREPKSQYQKGRLDFCQTLIGELVFGHFDAEVAP